LKGTVKGAIFRASAPAGWLTVLVPTLPYPTAYHFAHFNAEDGCGRLLQNRYLSTKLHGIRSQNTVILILSLYLKFQTQWTLDYPQ
jgi:hypothetical protein